MTTLTKIGIKFNFGFELLAQAFCHKVRIEEVSQIQFGSVSSHYICVIEFGSKLTHMHKLELWESYHYQMMLRYKEWTFEA